jgi:hypothetical protein
VKGFLAGFLPSFVVKLEGDFQESGYLFPHAHLLLPAVSEVRPFLVAMKLSGAKVVQPKYEASFYPIRLASSRRIESLQTCWSISPLSPTSPP